MVKNAHPLSSQRSDGELTSTTARKEDHSALLLLKVQYSPKTAAETDIHIVFYVCVQDCPQLPDL